MAVRVLIIDDSLIERDSLRQHLECMGCEVVAEAENTQQALRLFRTVSPTLVTLDFSVPQTGGLGVFALFRIMRAERPEVPVMILTAQAGPEIRATFMREGAVDYILKPVKAESFARVCNRLVELFPALRRFNQTDPPVAQSSRLP